MGPVGPALEFRVELHADEKVVFRDFYRLYNIAVGEVPLMHRPAVSRASRNSLLNS